MNERITKQIEEMKKQTIGAVSYTHLDVYKRQSFVCSVFKGRPCSDSNRGRSYQTASW